MDTRLISDLEAALSRRTSALPRLIRPFTREAGTLPRAVILTGPRGVGKTTFLIHHAKGRKILYLSADNPRFSGESLYETVKSIFMQGYEGVIVDEVHFARDWSVHLKSLYDDFPRHSLWISDSSALVLRIGYADTSRRFLPITMPLLSFREFLFLETGIESPPCNPFNLTEKLPAEPSPSVLEAFRSYREKGTRPFYGEPGFAERMLAILDKTLYADVPFFLPNITDGNLRLMKAVVGTLAAASIPRLQVRSLCADWGIGADKLYQILEVMESVGVLRVIRPENDRKAKSAGAKLFFSDPAFYPILSGDRGIAREALTASLCADTGWTVEASRDETAGDFVVSRVSGDGTQNLRIEVGGAGKRKKSADFVIRDDIDYPGGNVIPLWLLGMGY